MLYNWIIYVSEPNDIPKHPAGASLEDFSVQVVVHTVNIMF
jgi:hypothetical protein